MDENHSGIIGGIEAVCAAILIVELDVAFDLDNARHSNKSEVMKCTSLFICFLCIAILVTLPYQDGRVTKMAVPTQEVYNGRLVKTVIPASASRSVSLMLIGNSRE